MNFKIGDSIDNYDDLRKLPEGTVLTAHDKYNSIGDRILETRDGKLGLWNERGSNSLGSLTRGQIGKLSRSLHYVIKELPEEPLTLDQIRSLPHGTKLRMSGCSSHFYGSAPDGTGWFSDHRIVEHDGSHVGLRQAFPSGTTSENVLDITNMTTLPLWNHSHIKGFYLIEEPEETVNELDAFKAKVVEVATRYAKAYEMCDVVDDALEELGLSRNRKRRLVFTITADITVDRDVDINNIDGNVTVNLLDHVADAIRESLRADFRLETTSISDVIIEER